MIVPVSKKNEKEWLELCIALWPDTTVQDLIEGRATYKLSDFLYYINDEAVAFISLSIRHEYVEGTESSPVGYIEGIYVKPDHRKRGIANKLVAHAKDWAFSQGCNEIASDTELHNEDSQIFHEKIGFVEANRVVCYSLNLLRKNEKPPGMDAKSPEFKAAMSAVRERIATVKRRERRDGFIDYYGCRNICHEFQSILGETHKPVVRGHYVYAYSVAVLVQVNLAKLASTADDSAGSITDTQTYVNELLEKVCVDVEYESPDHEYTLIRSKRKTIALQIKNGAVEVRAPLQAPKKDIDKFIASKEKWIADRIAKSQERMERRENFTLNYNDNALYLGKEYPITARSGDRVGFDDNTKEFYIPPHMSPERIKAAVVQVYKMLAKRDLTHKAYDFAKQMDVKIASVKINSAKTRWGSCSARPACCSPMQPGSRIYNINFSWRLILADEATVDYVVIHELAHTIEMNHSARFWAIVESVLPDYKQRQARLKELQKRLGNEDWDTRHGAVIAF